MNSLIQSGGFRNNYLTLKFAFKLEKIRENSGLISVQNIINISFFILKACGYSGTVNPGAVTKPIDILIFVSVELCAFSVILCATIVYNSYTE